MSISKELIKYWAYLCESEEDRVNEHINWGKTDEVPYSQQLSRYVAKKFLLIERPDNYGHIKNIVLNPKYVEREIYLNDEPFPFKGVFEKEVDAVMFLRKVLFNGTSEEYERKNLFDRTPDTTECFEECCGQFIEQLQDKISIEKDFIILKDGVYEANCKTEKGDLYIKITVEHPTRLSKPDITLTGLFGRKYTSKNPIDTNDIRKFGIETHKPNLPNESKEELNEQDEIDYDEKIIAAFKKGVHNATEEVDNAIKKLLQFYSVPAFTSQSEEFRTAFENIMNMKRQVEALLKLSNT